MMAGLFVLRFCIFVPSSKKNIHINRKMEKETKAIHTLFRSVTLMAHYRSLSTIR